MPDPAQVSVQFRFSDSSNSSSNSHEALLWNGLRAGHGRPHAHMFSITSRGRAGGPIAQTKRIRAAIATGVPEEPHHQMRVLSWEDLGT